MTPVVSPPEDFFGGVFVVPQEGPHMSNKNTAADFVPPGSVPIVTVLTDPSFVSHIPEIETWRDAPAKKADKAEPTESAKSVAKKEN